MEAYVGVDVGGTFTDVAVSVPAENRLIRFKLPSTPAAPDRAIIDGIVTTARESDFDVTDIVRLAHGTTVGTNALIQRNCGRVAVVTTEGFGDLLEIRRQSRPRMYDIHLDHPPPLAPRKLRFEVPERRRADGVVHKALDEAAVLALAPRLQAAAVDCVVVCFLHSYAYPEHETRAVALLREALPATMHVIASSSIYPEFREFERFSTAVLNGALLPVMNAYLDRFMTGVVGHGIKADPKLSQSAGGLMSVAMARDLPVRSALSGPAAGVLGAAYRAKTAGFSDVITLDVGGTSTDVSMIQDGAPREARRRDLAGYPLLLPTIDVNAVGAGGGSIGWIDLDGLLKVGPHSAGAEPGPACYGAGGDAATVTDANVLLGRLNPNALLDGRMPIERDLAERAVGVLAAALGLDLYETALGIVRVASATIVKAIGTISVERGHNPADFALFAFGGAGPLHAPEVARELDMTRIIVPPNPGILCAEGLLTSDLTADFVDTSLQLLTAESAPGLEARRQRLVAAAETWFANERVPAANRQLNWVMQLRYHGQNFELSVPFSGAPIDAAACLDMSAAFHGAHEHAYGYAATAEQVEFVSLRLRTVGLLDRPTLPKLAQGAPAEPIGERAVSFTLGAWQATPIYRREALTPGQTLNGPAIIEQLDTTTLVFPGDTCVCGDWGDLVITLG